NCTDHFNCQRGNGNVVEQIESGCESGQWSNRVEGSTEPTLIVHKPLSSLSTTAREDCSACVSPELASELGITTDSVTHCVACNSACDQGLMRCFGIGASDCCNFYNNSVCVEQCPSPFVSNSDSICVCPEGTTGHNCEDVVGCGSLLAPANGLVNVSTTVFNSTATYSCNGGYNLVGDTTRTCLASDLWSGIKPTCTVVDCGGLPDPENGTATVADTIFNSTATFSCNDGYNLVGEETRRCLASGNWSANEPSCVGCTQDCIKCDAIKCTECRPEYELHSNGRLSACIRGNDNTGLTLREKVLLAVTVVFGALLIALAVTAVFLGLKLSKKNARSSHASKNDNIEMDENSAYTTSTEALDRIYAEVNRQT
ncbi:Sushi, von Willebrand factor type A, EGF and pentraxin domain-containing protein 1, partial [Geodia barretti]